MEFVSTCKQLADGMTKDLDRIKFENFRDTVVKDVREWIDN